MSINHKIFDSFPVLTTRRLTLREIRPADAIKILEMRSSGRINQFIARDQMNSLADAQQLVEKTFLAFRNYEGIGWAGILTGGEQLIGTCGFNHIDFPNLRAEIGGELSVESWGKNIAIEAVEAIVHFGLHTMNLHTIEARVSPDNRGAIYLLEKLGFNKEAHFEDRIYFNGHFSDVAVYTLIKGRETLRLQTDPSARLSH